MDSRRWRCPFGWEGGSRAFLLGIAALGAMVLFAPRSDRPPDPPPRLVVDLNEAPRSVLQTLPRLGPARAGAIVTARRDRRFASLEDFEHRVRGVGPATRRGIEPYVRLDR